MADSYDRLVGSVGPERSANRGDPGTDRLSIGGPRDLRSRGRGPAVSNLPDGPTPLSWATWLCAAVLVLAFIGLEVATDAVVGRQGSGGADATSAPTSDTLAVASLDDPEASQAQIIDFIKSVVCAGELTTLLELNQRGGFTMLTCHNETAPVVFRIYRSPADFRRLLAGGLTCSAGWSQATGPSWYARSRRSGQVTALLAYGGVPTPCRSGSRA